MVDSLASQVENEKLKVRKIHYIFVLLYLSVLLQAIGARNHIKSIAKERESQKQQLQLLIAEKKIQLERYNGNRFSVHAL